MIWSTVALAALFEPGPSIEPTGEWSNKVVLEDLDLDGDLDILFANGGNYSSPGSPAPQRLFRNEGDAFIPWMLPGEPELSRSIQVGDLDGDGRPDLFVSAVYQRPSRLFLGTEEGFVEASERLPTTPMSIGDVELGDVDGDGDLDAVLADWGPGNPLSNDGGPVRLWLNDAGTFTEAEASIPDRTVGMSWDLELVDVDRDFDLDILVSSKPDAGSVLFLNQGDGTFEDATQNLPAFSNNYEFAPMDLEGDGDFDLVTINDGNQLREHILINTGEGVFESGNGTVWPPSENAGEDDNVVVWTDLDDDGDADFVIGSLSGADRAMYNDAGVLRNAGSAFGGPFTSGTLSLALGDLNDDGKVDAVMAQGELADTDLVYWGVDVATDTQAPVIVGTKQSGTHIWAQVHDRMTPMRASDVRVYVTHDGGQTDLVHMGGFLWDGEVPPAAQVALCTHDRQGNERCLDLNPIGQVGEAPPEGEDGKTCGCQSGGSGAIGLAGLLARRR